MYVQVCMFVSQAPRVKLSSIPRPYLELHVTPGPSAANPSCSRITERVLQAVRVSNMAH